MDKLVAVHGWPTTHGKQGKARQGNILYTWALPHSTRIRQHPESWVLAADKLPPPPHHHHHQHHHRHHHHFTMRPDAAMPPPTVDAETRQYQVSVQLVEQSLGATCGLGVVSAADVYLHACPRVCGIQQLNINPSIKQSVQDYSRVHGRHAYAHICCCPDILGVH